MSRRPVNPSRHVADSGSIPFSTSLHQKSRFSPLLLSVGLVIVGALLLIGYSYSGSGGLGADKVVSNAEALRSSTKNFPSFEEHQSSVFNSGGNHKSASMLCNYTEGAWIYDSTVRSARYESSCKEIFKGWNCISNKKSNALDIVKWRWKPYGCDLDLLDPVWFLQRFRNTSIGFVGDSLNRNMFVSLVCSLKKASNEVKKWRPAGADRGFTFLRYNLTVAYHRTNLLARYGGRQTLVAVC